MITLLLAFLNAKYKSDYQLLFLGTFLLDMELISRLWPLIEGAIK